VRQKELDIEANSSSRYLFCQLIDILAHIRVAFIKKNAKMTLCRDRDTNDQRRIAVIAAIFTILTLTYFYQ
jgi:hypothetical protein